jgi:hypothetical protein
MAVIAASVQGTTEVASTRALLPGVYPLRELEGPENVS